MIEDSTAMQEVLRSTNFRKCIQRRGLIQAVAKRAGNVGAFAHCSDAKFSGAVLQAVSREGAKTRRKSPALVFANSRDIESCCRV